MRLAVPVRLAGLGIRPGRNGLRRGLPRYDRSSGGYSVVSCCSDTLGNLFCRRRPQAGGHHLRGFFVERDL